MASRGSVVFDGKVLGRNLDTLSDRVDTSIAALMDFQASKTEKYAKETAPWTDRTSNARNGLRTETEWVPKKFHALRLFHTMPYGIWLEIRHAGRFAVIAPTIKVQGVATMRLLNQLLGKLKAGGLF